MTATTTSTEAQRLTAAWKTLRAHGITLDGCDLPAESILAIAAIASGDSRAPLPGNVAALIITGGSR